MRIGVAADSIHALDGAFGWLAGGYYGRDTTHYNEQFHFFDSTVQGYFVDPATNKPLKVTDEKGKAIKFEVIAKRGANSATAHSSNSSILRVSKSRARLHR